ncbi:MAG: AMP-binding protein [Myxococcota bacterium]
MISLRLLWRSARALWRSGLLPVSPLTTWRLLGAWRRCSASLALLAEGAALRCGERLALHDDDGPVTFVELRREYERLARELVDRHGIGPGRQVALLGPNHRTTVVALLAVARTGADALLLNPQSPPAVLRRLLAPNPPDLLLVAGDVPVDVGDFSIAVKQIQLSAAEVSGPSALPPKPLPRLRRPGRVVVLTSGSTGLARRVGRQPGLGQVLSFAVGLLEALPIALHRPTVGAVPLFHGHGLAMLSISLAFAAPLQLGRKCEVAPLLARVPAGPLPLIVSVPTLLHRWLALGTPSARVAAVVTGSAPLDPDLCTRLLDALGPVLFNLYGSTEAGVLSLATPDMLRAAPGTVGKPLPGNGLRLVTADGTTAATGPVGRVQARGPLVLSTDAQGWLDTGDLGWLDPDGRLLLSGRADAMVVSGGENVYPAHLEGCLAEHPEVQDVAVAVVDDAEFGKRLRAFIVPRDGIALDPQVLGPWLHARVDRALRPRSLIVLTQLPRTPLGKIDRAGLEVWPEAEGDAQAEPMAVPPAAVVDGTAPRDPALHAQT